MNEAVGCVGPNSGKEKEQILLPLIPAAKTHFRTADVIATGSPSMVMFEAQTHLAASWLSSRCGAELDNIHDQICVDARQQDQIIRDLKAAGFQVITQKI
ncbi:MAG TPA: hypothetical protein VL361_14280 [Candidatus Limnocylindrales bacterium]|jgi:hypothetical protein|nr:hypothetical protein [Candidatus Limnocylindrales bacterium]